MNVAQSDSYNMKKSKTLKSHKKKNGTAMTAKATLLAVKNSSYVTLI